MNFKQFIVNLLIKIFNSLYFLIIYIVNQTLSKENTILKLIL